MLRGHVEYHLGCSTRRLAAERIEGRDVRADRRKVEEAGSDACPLEEIENRLSRHDFITGQRGYSRKAIGEGVTSVPLRMARIDHREVSPTFGSIEEGSELGISTQPCIEFPDP